MTVLITGGAGYIGSHCNKVFRENGYNTLVLDDLSNGHRKAVGDSELIIGDIGDKNLLKKIFSENNIDGVIHLAAKKSVEESVYDPCLYYENNVVKSKILLDTMKEYDIKKIVFSSTAATYGDVDVDVVDEFLPTNPINPYGESKLMFEKIMRDYDTAYGMKHCSLRYFNAAGADPDGELGYAGKKETNVMPLLIDAANGVREFTVFGDDYDTRDGTCIRDYIHVTDLAEAHLYAFEYLRNSAKSEIMNLGSSNGYSVLELIRETENVTNKKLDYKIGPRRAGDPKILIASNKKAKELLGWKPKYSQIGDIIKDSYNWDRNRKY